MSKLQTASLGLTMNDAVLIFTIVGLTVVALVGLLTYGAISSINRAEERQAMEGPRNKEIQDLVLGKKITHYWQPEPPSGDIYIELEDGTKIKLSAEHDIEVIQITNE